MSTKRDRDSKDDQMRENDQPSSSHKSDEEEDIDEFVEEDENGSDGALKKLKDKFKKVKEENKELLDGWQRARADFANLLKEKDESYKKAKLEGKREVIRDFLKVMDSFDMAFSNKEAWEAVDKDWRIGVEYIYSQARRVLEEHGVEQFGEIGDEFNPNLHHSSKTEDTDKEAEDGKIVAVVQKGYKIGGDIIRPATVKVGNYKK